MPTRNDWAAEAEAGVLPSLDDCAYAMDHVQTFLHSEESDDTADEIRHHLMTCEHCLEIYNIESLIAVMVRRSSAHPEAPIELRERISWLHVTVA